jgi:exopolysaccharide biosynthesis polyprenyl glycosylphosphotransferase
MLKEKNKIIVRGRRLLDILLTLVALGVAFYLKKHILPGSFRGLKEEIDYLALVPIVIIIWYISLNWFQAYFSYRSKRLGEIIANTIKSVSASFMALSLVLYLLKIIEVSRLMMGLFFVLNLLLLLISKIIIYKLLNRIRKDGFNTRNILIVGTRERAKKTIEIIHDNEGTGFRILGCLDIDKEIIGKTIIDDYKTIDVIENLEKVLSDNVVDELIFAMPLRGIENADKYITMAENMGVNTRIIPDWEIYCIMYTPGVARIKFENFLDMPTMVLKITPPNEGDLFIKACMDKILAVIAFAILLPLFIIIAVLIKLFSKGPVFFSQERFGLNGRTFQMLKFRTMVNNAEDLLETIKEGNEMDGPVFKIKKDPRIIPWVGTLLRKTSLDELPQLINILRGEMSIVGPRPPIPGEVNQYELWQRRRLSMKPGLTCLWQIAPKRNDISFDAWMKMDLEYIDKWSLGLDFKLIFQTFKIMLSGAGR